MSQLIRGLPHSPLSATQTLALDALSVVLVLPSVQSLCVTGIQLRISVIPCDECPVLRVQVSGK